MFGYLKRISLLRFIKRKLNLQMYVVEYLTSSMIEPKKFVFTFAEENLNKEIKFDNEVSQQTLVLNKERLEYYITSEYNVN